MTPSLPLSLVTFTTLIALSAGDASISTYNGTINGAQCADSQANYFFGIPYGKAPERFAPPQLFDSKYGNSGTLDATKPAPNCIQFGNVFTEPGPESEDCLLLDIYTPFNVTSSSALPVKVFLYGINNSGGSISDGTYLGCNSAKDAIMVTVNYRLGPLGFLSLPSAGPSGNYGIQDQILALQWIQHNIHSFGGDPKKVLLFGQSAGATDASIISTLPQASSLFSAVAAESGAGKDIATIEEASVFTSTFVEMLNCSTTDGDCIRAASVEQLNQVFKTSQVTTVGTAATLWWNYGFGSDWGPVVDGNIIATQPSQVSMRVPSILGSNAAEANLFVAAVAASDPDLNGTPYRAFLSKNFGPLAETVAKAYPLSAFNSAPSPSYAAQSVISTDYIFKCPTYRALLVAEANGIDQVPAILKTLGPALMSEIPFVFGNVDHLPAQSGNCTMTAGKKAISAFMEGAWTNMAASGKPTINDTDWPKWNKNTSMGIAIGDTVEVAKVDYSVCEFWDQIDATIFELDANGTAAANATTSPPSLSSTDATTGAGAGVVLVKSNTLGISLLALFLSMGLVL